MYKYIPTNVNVDKYIFLGFKTNYIVITESLNCTCVSIDYIGMYNIFDISQMIQIFF